MSQRARTNTRVGHILNNACKPVTIRALEVSFARDDRNHGNNFTNTRQRHGSCLLSPRLLGDLYSGHLQRARGDTDELCLSPCPASLHPVTSTTPKRPPTTSLNLEFPVVTVRRCQKKPSEASPDAVTPHQGGAHSGT